MVRYLYYQLRIWYPVDEHCEAAISVQSRLGMLHDLNLTLEFKPCLKNRYLSVSSQALSIIRVEQVLVGSGSGKCG